MKIWENDTINILLCIMREIYITLCVFLITSKIPGNILIYFYFICRLIANNVTFFYFGGKKSRL